MSKDAQIKCRYTTTRHFNTALDDYRNAFLSASSSVFVSGDAMDSQTAENGFWCARVVSSGNVRCNKGRRSVILRVKRAKTCSYLQYSIWTA
jgi:hypothetical protein